MRATHRLGFALFGLMAWAVGTAIFRCIGAYCFEGTLALYWFSVVGVGLLFAAVSLGLMKWQGIAQQNWLQAAVWMAVPGMLGEVPVLADFAEWMSNLQPETAGRYGALLFSGYALLLGLAAGLSTKASLELATESGQIKAQQ